MGGGGGGGTNPASGFTKQFGADIQESGDFLLGTSRGLEIEARQAFDQISPFADQILQNAFDPQQQLYHRTLQNVTDQTRSGEAARGVANTPYGAAAEGNALGNFNIDWQNNLLQREALGLGAATGAYTGVVGAGATAAQPAEAAMQGWANAFNTASQASTADLNRQQQAKEAQASQMSGKGGDIGGIVGSLAGGGL